MLIHPPANTPARTCSPVCSRGVVNTSYTLSMVTRRILESRASRGFSSRIYEGRKEQGGEGHSRSGRLTARALHPQPQADAAVPPCTSVRGPPPAPAPASALLPPTQ